MGWGSCGEDSTGRPIGYTHEATCDHPGCDKKIDRGLAYACGGMHGEGNIYDQDCGCEKYFCEAHLIVIEVSDHKCVSVCHACYADAIKRGYDEETGEWNDTDA